MSCFPAEAAVGAELHRSFLRGFCVAWALLCWPDPARGAVGACGGVEAQCLADVSATLRFDGSAAVELQIGDQILERDLQDLGFIDSVGQVVVEGALVGASAFLFVSGDAPAGESPFGENLAWLVNSGVAVSVDVRGDSGGWIAAFRQAKLDRGCERWVFRDCPFCSDWLRLLDRMGCDSLELWGCVAVAGRLGVDSRPSRLLSCKSLVLAAPLASSLNGGGAVLCDDLLASLDGCVATELSLIGWEVAPAVGARLAALAPEIERLESRDCVWRDGSQALLLRSSLLSLCIEGDVVDWGSLWMRLAHREVRLLELEVEVLELVASSDGAEHWSDVLGGLESLVVYGPGDGVDVARLLNLTSLKLLDLTGCDFRSIGFGCVASEVSLEVLGLHRCEWGGGGGGRASRELRSL
ncbi:hypothetical protein Pla163_10940 [Planctomycetes bacterium Pla163]|uniref:Uncharacterized protein n=1 Tax=Rohdeia mirabilis TaxID=2528008 RepID=A0A518CXN8_9BACT|nr:hypothetical protein Pla163_10940 [Planctomycetes bacterium Pla163]